MTDYNEVVTAWNHLYPKLHWRFLLKDMPFFRVLMAIFYKNNTKEYITPEEMKTLILHYKNALNLYKENLRNKVNMEYTGNKCYYLLKKIQSEYNTLLEIYDDLLNIEDMTNGKIYTTTRTTKKTNR